MDPNEMEKRKSDPGRPKPPTPAQQSKIDELRQQLKDGQLKFQDFSRMAHLVLENG